MLLCVGLCSSFITVSDVLCLLSFPANVLLPNDGSNFDLEKQALLSHRKWKCWSLMNSDLWALWWEALTLDVLGEPVWASVYVLCLRCIMRLTARREFLSWGSIEIAFKVVPKTIDLLAIEPFFYPLCNKCEWWQHGIFIGVLSIQSVRQDL